MNAILGLGNLLLQEPLAPRQREWIRRIRQNGQHLVELVNDLLDVTRIEAGRVRLESVPFALDEVLGQAADVLEREAVAKGLEVGIAVDDDVPRMLRGDRRRVAQLLLNYVSNAVKYTEHGRIELRVRAERVAGRIRLQVEVEDTGIGLTEAQRSRLFRPFEQLEPGATRFEGAGLGLSICKWLATAMDGDVGVESTRGVGSTFWFSVLLDDIPDAVAIEEPDGDAGDAKAVVGVLERLAKARVLVVDDNAINRIVTGEILRQAGVDVREADGGEAAVLLTERHCPDVVLMDLQMPEVDGFEAARRLRERAGGAAPPVIGMTASPMATVRSRCLAAGMVEVLEKPFEAEQLLALVAQWLPDAEPAESVRPERPEPHPRLPPAGAPSDPAVLDRAAGLHLLGGNEPMYARLLGMLDEEQARALPAAAEALRHGDREQARPLVHSLAGACAILGADAAHAAARELLALLTEAAPLPVCEDALELLAGEIGRLLVEIERGPPSAPEDVRAA
jgi:two-component system sensor histidine kinase/response regulator